MPTKQPSLDDAMAYVLEHMVKGQPIGQSALEKKVGMGRSALRRYCYVLIDAGHLTYEPPGKMTATTKFTRVKERLLVPQQRVRRAVKASEGKSLSQLVREYEKAVEHVATLRKQLAKILAQEATK